MVTFMAIAIFITCVLVFLLMLNPGFSGELRWQDFYLLPMEWTGPSATWILLR